MAKASANLELSPALAASPALDVQRLPGSAVPEVGFTASRVYPMGLSEIGLPVPYIATVPGTCPYKRGHSPDPHASLWPPAMQSPTLPGWLSP